jgi:hypothetical protein
MIKPEELKDKNFKIFLGMAYYNYNNGPWLMV